MEEADDGMEKPNGVFVELTENRSSQDEEVTISGILRCLVADIFFPDPDRPTSVIHRIKASLLDNAPLFREASRNTGRDVLLWTRRGGPFRALLVVSVGTIALLALTGLLVFILFFLAATINAIVISLLMSLAVAGGILAIFFAFTMAIYIGVLTVAVFVISTATISAIIAVLVITGWIGFFWTVCLVTRKSAGLAKHSLTVTGSTVSTYSSSWLGCCHHEPVKVSD
ncbi:hypothetical protein U1Q18_011389 [Sarracenia purpurea var. burkii]